MANQKDVAKLANVSFITVSRVINKMGNVKPETRRRVENAIKELNYYPNSIAQGLNRNRVMTIAIETSLNTSATIEETSYYTRILTGVERLCIKRGYDILISSQRGQNNTFDCLKPFYSRKADGVIILGTIPTEKQFQQIIDDCIPSVIIGDRHPSFEMNYIDTDNYRGMFEATEYLIKNGHSKIAYIKGNVDNQNAIDRFKGFSSAMSQYSLPINNQWILNGDYSKDSGSRCYKDLIKLIDLPTAIICSTDLMALGVYEAIRNNGDKVPDKISIIGFDGHELCRYTDPPLTTVRQPLEDMGEEAANVLIDNIEQGNIKPKQHIFPVQLNYGASVKDLTLLPND